MYDFLNNRTHSPGSVAGYCIGILVGAIIIFLIVRCLIMLRVWLTEKKMGMIGKFTARGAPRPVSMDTEKNIGLVDMSRK